MARPSEFGGSDTRNRVQPRPHVPTASEQLMLIYTTADPTGLSDPDEGETFQGLIHEEEQRAIREQEGVLAAEAETLFEEPEAPEPIA